MGIFSGMMDLFRPKAKTFFGSSAKSAPFTKEIYEQETVRAIIDCIASHAAKAQALHVVVDKDDRVKEIKRNSPYVKLLNQRPNEIMSGFDLKYKLITQREDKTTAMAYIKWGDKGIPEAIIPVQYRNFEFYEVVGGGYAVKFVDETDGKEYALPLEDVVVLRKFYNNRTVAGDGNGPIYNTLSMIKSSDEGITEALTVANKVRGLLKQKKSMLADDDVEKSTKEFVERFQKAAKEGGVVGVDAMEDFTPMTVTPWSANAAQMREIRANLFYFWRINESILKSDYTEDQWRAFYEGVLEPILIQLGQAFTNACFTPRERDVGNRIIFGSSLMINSSMQTKVNLLSNSKEIGLLTLNEQRELFGYVPVVGGDERYVSLNYIKASDATKYQVGDDPPPDDPPPQDDPQPTEVNPPADDPPAD